jgi:trypsin
VARTAPWTLLVAAALAAALASAPAAAAPGRPRIVHPEPGLDAIPWQAALVTPGTHSVFCGATLRGDPATPSQVRYVITAAHCLLPTDGPGTLQVLAGMRDRTGADPYQRLEVDLVSSAPGWNADTYQLDAAVLRLAAPVAVVPGEIEGLPVVPPGVPDTGGVIGAPAIISGWGVSAFGSGTRPVDLRHGFVDVQPHAACSAYGAMYDPATMLCAGRVTAGGIVDTCQGDSGGPLARQTAGVRADLLVGIVSWGSTCAEPGYPGIYTNLTNPAMNTFVRRDVGDRPVARGLPSIEGTGSAGEPLTCAVGAWDNADALAVAWVRRVAGSTVPVASGPAYTPTRDDTGHALACLVTATNPWGAAEAPSPDRAITRPHAAGSTNLPRARLVRRTCARRRCQVTVRVPRDAGSSALRVVATLQRRTGCRTRRARRHAACRPRTLAGHRVRRGRFTLRTGRLRRGRYRLTVIAADVTGRRRLRPTVIALRVR